jgi:5,10-methylenetetrahydromethanopterin reductase
MRVGVAFIPGMPYRRVVALARLAEDLGYDDLHIPDQTFHRDPFALLALCAETTERIGLGLAVTNPYTRHPVQIARGAGLLAEVSGGRFALGLGAGNRPRVLTGLGMEQTGIVARLRETIDVVRRLLAGETVSYDSPTLTLRDVSLDFDPGFGVPIFVATRGPRVLALAGEIADGVMLEGLFTPTALDWALERIAAGAALAGREAETIDMIAWQALFLGDADLTSLQRWAALLISTTRPEVLARIGVSDASIQAVARAVSSSEGAGEPTADVAPDDAAKLLLVGTPEQVRERIDGLRERGVSAVACVLFGGPDEIEATMRRFAGVIR